MEILLQIEDEPKRIGGEKKMRVIYNGSCILLMIVRMYFYLLGQKCGQLSRFLGLRSKSANY